MADYPKFPATPLELLENDGTREAPLLSKVWGPAAGGVLGFVGTCYANWASRRPVFSGIQKHIAICAAGILIGKIAEDYRAQYFADRDAVFRHYIELHPEDFPPYERKKIADIFEPWIPVR